ncbi:hypothetical protein EF808_04535 [archaeon]|nr:MAG: hypothetical protein EF808_04535 [archaeon]
MNKRSLLVFGLFWALLVPIVSAGAVACDGLYWGDSIGEPTGTADVGNGHMKCLSPPGAEQAMNNAPIEIPPFQGQDDIVTITSGLYWGD